MTAREEELQQVQSEVAARVRALEKQLAMRELEKDKLVEMVLWPPFLPRCLRVSYSVVRMSQCAFLFNCVCEWFGYFVVY